MTPAPVADAIFAAARPRALAALVRTFRDVDFAEDAFQDACLKAAEKWPADGVPRDPLAWLIRVGRNAALDRLRRLRRQSSESAEAILDARAADDDNEADVAEALDRTEYKDDVLRLMFMCCHAELKPHEQLALALRVIVGFTVEEIARAFVVTPDTMQRRLSRAKARAATIAERLEAPDAAERAKRLDAVQAMIYLMFNEGYAASGGDTHIRLSLCDEAIRLARLLLELFPGQTELMGLLALCLLQNARRAARIGSDGELVTLEDQDRRLWNHDAIAEGQVLVEKALRKGRPGPLQVQAAIAAIHCRAARAEATDWAEIEVLYRALEALRPSPVVRLNHAVAIAKVEGPAAALAVLDGIEEDLADYRPFHAVRGGLLEEAGDVASANAAYRAALALGPTRQEESHLLKRIAMIEEKLPGGVR